MKKEQSLIEKKDGVFSKIFNKIKMFLFKNKKSKKDMYCKDEREAISKENEIEKSKINTNKEKVKIINNPINDLEILRKIIKNELKIEDIDNDTKKRLIYLCDKREKEIDKKINDTQKQINNIDNIIKKIS